MTGQGGQFYGVLVVWVLFFIFMYVFLIRPQRQQQRKRTEMLAKVKKGDRVVTMGGLYANIVEAADDTLTLELAPNVRVKAERSAVARVRGRREGE